MSERSDLQRMPRSEVSFLILCGIFLVSLVVANLITAKLFVLSGVVLAAGIIPYPVTFLATDLISEVYGRKRASTLVWVGFGLSLYVLVLLKLGQVAQPFEGLDVQHEYDVMFGGSARAIVASMIAYLVAQLIDVKLFHFWKELTRGKHLWLRNNGSTLISQLVDTVLVVTILFWGKLSGGDIVAIIVAGYVFKLLIALVDTPFFYFGARYLRAAVDPQAPQPTRRDLVCDSALAAACLGAVATIVGAAITWDGTDPQNVLYGWGNPSGFSLLVVAAVGLLLATVGLARSDLRVRAALAAGACGVAAGVVAGAQIASFPGSGPAVGLAGAVVLAGA